MKKTPLADWVKVSGEDLQAYNNLLAKIEQAKNEPGTSFSSLSLEKKRVKGLLSQKLYEANVAVFWAEFYEGLILRHGPTVRCNVFNDECCMIQY